MKKYNLILTAMLAIALCFTAVACGDKEDVKPNNEKKLADDVTKAIQDFKNRFPSLWNERYAEYTYANGVPQDAAATARMGQKIAGEMLLVLKDHPWSAEDTKYVQDMYDACVKYLTFMQNNVSRGFGNHLTEITSWKFVEANRKVALFG